MAQRREMELKRLEEEEASLAEYLSDGAEDHPEDEVSEAQLRDFSTIIVVDNLPKVPMSKFDKLKSVVQRIYGQIGQIANMDMPDAGGKTLGFAFIEFFTAAEATKAVTNTNGWPLDKRHVFVVNHYADVVRYLTMPSEYKEPVIEEYAPYINHIKITGENLRAWLADSFYRDQFVIRYAQETEIYWCETSAQPTQDYAGARQKKEGKNWCEMYVQWSPNGTYLATFHHQGVALWGGSKWKRFFRLAHTGVQFIDFSPNENYLVTWNGQTGASKKQAIIVWDLNLGTKLRQFSYDVVPERNQWPAFKWSHSDAYMARMVDSCIDVFSSKASGEVGKKTNRPMHKVCKVEAPNITEFSFSPTMDVLCYWAPEAVNMPARVCLVSVPDKKSLRQKNLYSVVDCKTYWHPQGTFLCIQVTRHSKTKKTFFTNFEMFRMRDADVPVEMFEMKENVAHLAWEPNGVRFGVVHSNNETKANVSFYTMDKAKGGEKLELLYTLQDKPCNRLYWSPIGRHCVIAGQQSPHNGVLEFFDVDEETSNPAVEHFMCTNVQWDPSGRIVASVVCQPLFGAASMRHQLENGYCLWSFQGLPLYRMQKQNFYQFEWRPRPSTLLTAEEQKDTVANIKEKRRKFEEMDRWMDSARSAKETRARFATRNEFRALLKGRRDEKAKPKKRQAYIDLLGWDSDDDSLYEVTTEMIEETIGTKEEVSRRGI